MPIFEPLATKQARSSSDQYDQELDTLLVGPIPIGVNKFIFEADAPDTKRIPDAEVIGVTVVLLSCAYDGREFVRVGYYVNNEYDDEQLQADPPAKPIIEKIRRNILAEKPRVTRFAIKWCVLQPSYPSISLAETNVLHIGTTMPLPLPSSLLSSPRPTWPLMTMITAQMRSI